MCYVSSEISIRENMGQRGSQNVAGDRKLKCSIAKTLRQMHDGISMLTLMRTSKRFIFHDYALKLFS